MFTKKYEPKEDKESGKSFLMQDKRNVTKFDDIDKLITQYNNFHEEWMEKLSALKNCEEQFGITDSNGNASKV